MPNEQYLRVSYFALVVLSLVLGVTVCRLLRKPFCEVTNTIWRGRFGALLSRALPLGTVMFVLASCLSVSYTATGCNEKRYQEVVADRTWIVAKNLQQVSETFRGITTAVLVWSALTIMLFALPKGRSEAQQQNSGKPREGQPEAK